jgi:hypothetical protein
MPVPKESQYAIGAEESKVGKEKERAGSVASTLEMVLAWVVVSCDACLL